MNKCDYYSIHLYEYCRLRYHDGIVFENRCSNYHVPKLDDILGTTSYSGYGQPVANTTTTIANTTAPDISNQTNQNVSQLVQPADIDQAEPQI